MRVAEYCECTNSHRIECFRIVNIYEFYVNFTLIKCNLKKSNTLSSVNYLLNNIVKAYALNIIKYYKNNEIFNFNGSVQYNIVKTMILLTLFYKFRASLIKSKQMTEGRESNLEEEKKGRGHK